MATASQTQEEEDFSGCRQGRECPPIGEIAKLSTATASYHFSQELTSSATYFKQIYVLAQNRQHGNFWKISWLLFVKSWERREECFKDILSNQRPAR